VRARPSPASLAILILVVHLLVACGPGAAPSTPAGRSARVDSSLSTEPTPAGTATLATSNLQNLASNPPMPRPTAAPTPNLSPLSTSELVKALVQAPNLANAVTAAQQALARGGVATTDLHTVIVPAVKPAASAVALPQETVNLALEARGRAMMATMTVDELGRMLNDFGFPFAPGKTPGEHMIAFFAEWIKEAQQAPSDPQNFNILFIAELAKEQMPSVDLATGTARPQDVRLTLLDLELLVAAFDRATTRAAFNASPSKDGISIALGAWLRNMVPVAEASEREGPCSQLTKRFGLLGEFNADVVKAATPTAVIKSLEHSGALSKTVATGLEHSLSALGAAARIWKLIATYRSSQVAVSLMKDSASRVHKPLESETDSYGDNLPRVGFVARAGINEKDWDDYQKSLEQALLDSELGRLNRDCMQAIGLPEWTTLKDIAESADQWRVQWSLIEGAEHARIDTRSTEFDWQGKQEQKLKRVSELSAEGNLYLMILPEQVHDTPILKQANVTVRADVKTSPGLNFETFASAVEGGFNPAALAKALVDVGAGWVQDMFPEKAYGTVVVEWHEPLSYVLELDSKTKFTAQGGVAWTAYVQATIPLKYDAVKKTWTGKGPVRYIRFDVSAAGACKISGKPTGGSFEVMSARIPLLPPMSGGAGIEMYVDTYEPNEQLTISCPFGTFSSPSSLWSTNYLNAHAISKDSVLLEWTLTNTSPIFAQKTFKRSVPFQGGIIDEDTVFDLKKGN
jgi:hypothetical protein